MQYYNDIEDSTVLKSNVVLNVPVIILDYLNPPT